LFADQVNISGIQAPGSQRCWALLELNWLDAVRHGGGGENDDNGDDETMNIVTMTTKKIL